MRISGPVDLASAVIVLLAVVAALLALVVTRRRETALAVLLDFLTAAGLLRLAADPGYLRAASAATVLVVRHTISWILVGRAKRRS